MARKQNEGIAQVPVTRSLAIARWIQLDLGSTPKEARDKYRKLVTCLIRNGYLGGNVPH